MQPRTIEGTQIDPAVVKVMKAIRQIESGGDYNSVGDAGAARGAFQYNEQTGPGWKNIARQYLGDENAQMDPANQNKATYHRIKEWKDKGFQPEEIAALWNGASKGPNGRYVCNNPEYCKNFVNTLGKGQQAAPIGNMQTQTTVPRETPEQGGILSQLGTSPQQPVQEPGRLQNRLDQGSAALSNLSEGLAAGNISQSISGGIQTVGSLAGGVLDVGDAALGLIPGYNAAMDFVGKKVVAPVIESLGGKQVYNQWQQFATEHPDAAKNIGALGNIVSVIPVFKAAKVGMDLAGDAIRSGVAKTGFVSTVENAAKEELRKSAANAPSKSRDLFKEATIKGEKVDPVNTIVDGDYLPEVVNDANGIPRYQSNNAIKKIDDALQADETNLQSMLEDASSKGLVGYVPMTALRNEAEVMIKKAFANQGNVDAALRKAGKIFDDYTKYKGDLVPLTELNNMKRGIREAVNFNSPKLSSDLRAQLGTLFMDTIEGVADKQGIKAVADINREMAKKIRAKEALEFLNERSITERPGFRTLLGRRAGDMSTVAGEAAGQAMGIPGVGAAAGRYLSNKAISGSGKSAVKKLIGKRAKKRLGRLRTVTALSPLLTQRPQGNQQEQK